MNEASPSTIRSIAAALIALVLTGCMLGGEATTYRLIEPAAPELEFGGASQATLAIVRPRTDRTRDTSRIIVRRERTLLPWSGASWIDRLPDLVQDMLVDSLDGRLATVGRAGELDADYRLELEVHRFELARSGDRLVAEVDLSARLRDASGRILDSTRVADGDELSEGESLEAAVAALERAFADVARALGDWLVEELPS